MWGVWPGDSPAEKGVAGPRPKKERKPGRGTGKTEVQGVNYFFLVSR